MAKAIIALVVTIIVGYIATVLGFEVIGDFREFGPIVAVAVMGAFIIYFNEKRNHKWNKAPALSF